MKRHRKTKKEFQRDRKQHDRKVIPLIKKLLLASGCKEIILNQDIKKPPKHEEFIPDIIAVYDDRVDFVEATGTRQDNIFIRADRYKLWLFQDVVIYSVLWCFNEIRRLEAAEIPQLFKRGKARGPYRNRYGHPIIIVEKDAAEFVAKISEVSQNEF